MVSNLAWKGLQKDADNFSNSRVVLNQKLSLPALPTWLSIVLDFLVVEEISLSIFYILLVYPCPLWLCLSNRGRASHFRSS